MVVLWFAEVVKLQNYNNVGGVSHIPRDTESNEKKENEITKNLFQTICGRTNKIS